MTNTNKQTFGAYVKTLLGVDGWAKVKQKFEEIQEPDPNAPVVPAAMMEATLVDGTKVTYEALAEGQKLTVVTAEGEIDAPDATHEFADGTKVTTQGGLITAIEAPAAAPDAPVMEEMTSEKVKGMIDEAMAALAPKKDEEMAQAFSAIQRENKALKEDMGTIVKLMDFFMEEQANPAPQPQKFGKEKAIENRKKVAELMAQYTIKP